MSTEPGSAPQSAIQWRIDLTSDTPGAVDLAWAMQALEIATTAGAWMNLAVTGGDSPVARALSSGSRSPKASVRFFPEFGAEFTGRDAEVRTPQAERVLAFLADIDPLDPLDVGVLVGLNSWLRNALLEDPSAYAEMFDFATVERIGNESPVVVVVLIPPAIKGAAAAIAGASAVAKGIHKYFKIKKTRNEAAKAAAEARRADAEAELAHARAEEARERARAIRESVRPQLAEQDLKGEIGRDLAEATDAHPEALGRASEVGARAAEAAIGQFESNPAVASVSIDGE